MYTHVVSENSISAASCSTGNSSSVRVRLLTLAPDEVIEHSSLTDEAVDDSTSTVYNDATQRDADADADADAAVTDLSDTAH